MEKKKMSTGVRVLLGFISALLCLLLIISVTLTILVADIRIVTTKDNMQKIIAQTFFAPPSPARPMPKLAAGAALNSVTPEDSSNPIQDLIVDAIYEIVWEESGGNLPVTREQIQYFLEESTVPEFLTDKVAGLVSDAYTGDFTTTVTPEEIEAVLEENADLIEKVFDVTIDQEAIDSVVEFVEEQEIIETVHTEIDIILGTGTGRPGGSAGSVASPSVGGSVNIVAVSLRLLRSASSVTVLVLYIILCLFLAALQFLTNWRRPGGALCWIAGGLLAASFSPLVITLLSVIAPSLLTSLPGWVGAAASVVSLVLQMTLPVTLVVLVLGVVNLIAGIVLNSLMKKRAKRA